MAQATKAKKLSSGPTRHVYDVIVLGGQLGGPLAAALLAKRNHRVLYVDHDGLGPGYEHGEWLLPYSPFVSPQLKSMPVVDDALVELGIHTTVQRALRPHEPALQLVLPKHRLDLHADEAKRLAELTREFGEAGARVSAALSRMVAQHEQSDRFFKYIDLPPVGLFGPWKLRREIGRRPELRETPALEGQGDPEKLVRELLPFVTWLDAPETPLAQTRPLSQVLKSPSHWPGGRDGLRELLVRRLIDLGGDVVSRETSDAWIAEQLNFEGRKLAGVQLLQSKTVFRAGAFIAATDSGALRRLIPDKKHHRRLTALFDLVETKRYLFTVNWVLAEELLPRGMGELVLTRGQDELGTMLVQLYPARKANGEEDPKLRVVCAGVFVPAGTRDLGEAHLEALKARIELELERLIPFARGRLQLSSAPYLDAGSVRGSRLLPHPLLSIDTESFAGITGIGPKTPVKNLFLASREVLPGLGFEGELLAGIRAARLVQQTLHKKNPLKR
ncbi:MAG: desaturase [Myxococcaceae bacterium]